MRLILHVDGADRSAGADADADVDDAAAAATSIPTSLAVVVVDMDWRRFTSTLCQCHLFCSLLTRTPFLCLYYYLFAHSLLPSHSRNILN